MASDPSVVDLKINYRGSRREVAQLLHNQLRAYQDNPLASWRWWSGFLCGALLIAALDYGDVWLCLGACGDNQPRVQVQQ